MRTATTVATLLTALALAACTSSGNDTAPSSPPATSASSPASTTGALTEAQAQAALLTAEQVGGDFTASPPDNSATPLPCTPNEPPLDQQVPADVKVRADFSGVDGKALFSEEIETFADADTVAAVIAAGERGLACGKATVAGTEVTISEPTDLADQLGTPVNDAKGWSLTSSAINAVLIVVQLGQHLAVFSFGADPSVEQSQLPDSEQIVGDGIAKLSAAIS